MLDSQATSLLEEFAEELEGTLHVIAHAGHYSDLDYIRRKQEYFRREYGHIFSDDWVALRFDESNEELAYKNEQKFKSAVNYLSIISLCHYRLR